MFLSPAVASMLLSLAPTASPGGAPCTALEVSFTTDCLRQPGDAACAFHAAAPDFGPQIAEDLPAEWACQYP